MSTLPSDHCLQRRRDVYHFRLRVPEKLVARVGRTEITQSLKTTSIKAARRERDILHMGWTAQFERLSAGYDVSSNAPRTVGTAPPGILSEHLIQLVRQFVEVEDRRRIDGLIANLPESENQRQEIIESVETGLTLMGDLNDHARDQQIDISLRRFRAALGVSQDDVPDGPGLAHLIERAMIEVEKRVLSWVKNERGSAFHDVLFDPERRSSVTFGDLAKQLMAQKREDADVNGISQKYVEKVEAQVGFFLEVLGSDTPVSVIDYDACVRVAGVLARLPTRRARDYPNQTITEAVEQAAQDGHPVLSVATQSEYLTVLRELLQVACRKRLVAYNPAEDVRPLRRETVAAAEKKSAFSQSQLASFFGSDFYQRCSKGVVPYRVGSAWRFWIPFFMIFQGMRPNEICQLHTSDVKQTSSGTWFIDVTADLDGSTASSPKTLKTAASKRQLRVHDQLIALGFLQFVGEQRERKSIRLFSDLNPDRFGNYAKYANKQFREVYLKPIGLQDRQSFYSFRHSYRDACRRAGDPPDLLAMGGWTLSRAVSDNYGSKFHPDEQSISLSKLTYPTVNLSPLYPKAAAAAEAIC